MIIYDELAKQDAFAAIERLGKMIAGSGMFGVTKPEQAQVMALTCMSDRITLVEFGRRYNIIEGKLSMKSDAMLARYLELGGKCVWLETTAQACRAKWTFSGNDIEIGFTIDDAVRAGLCGPGGSRKKEQAKDGNWQKYPDAMLRARCISKAIRMIAPQVNAGYYTPEEVQDFDDRPSPLAGAAGRKRMAGPTEPKEADAHVVDEAATPAQAVASGPLPPTEPEPLPPAAAAPSDSAYDPDAMSKSALAMHEEEVNAYLRHLKFINASQTWRDLTSLHRVRAMATPAKLIAQARNWSAEQKEKANVA
jgi:hypothetical protein